MHLVVMGLIGFRAPFPNSISRGGTALSSLSSTPFSDGVLFPRLWPSFAKPSLAKSQVWPNQLWPDIFGFSMLITDPLNLLHNTPPQSPPPPSPGPSAGPRIRRTPNPPDLPICSSFSLACHNFHSVFPLLGVFSWNFGGVLKTGTRNSPRTLNVYISRPWRFKRHQNSMRRPQEKRAPCFQVRGLPFRNPPDLLKL